jgi:hypothetical protein
VGCPILQDLEEGLIAESDKWLRIVREMMKDWKAKIEEGARQHSQWTVVLPQEKATAQARRRGGICGWTDGV